MAYPQRGSQYGSRSNQNRSRGSSRNSRQERQDWYDRDPMDERSGYRDENPEDYRGYNERTAERQFSSTERPGDYEDYRYRSSESYRPSDYNESSYDYTSRGQNQNYMGSSEYREELDRQYPRQRSQGSYGQSYNTNTNNPQGYGPNYNQSGLGYNQSYRDRSDTSETRGSFSGRGPKGYKRSDERIKEEVNEMLTRHSSIDADEIEVEVKEGEVTLTGSVPERRMKHLAEDVAEQCWGVKDVTNNLRVKRMEESSRSSSSLSSSGDRSSSETSSTSGSRRSSSSSSTQTPH